MKHILANKTKLLFATGCALAVLTTGCIREDLDACPSHKLTVKVVNVDGDDITGLGTEIAEAAVYVFDENYEHLFTTKMSREDVMGRRKIDLNYPAGKKLHAVAWGNAFQGNQDVTEGQIIEQLKVALKAQNEKANHPDKLYYGNEEVLTKAAETEVVDTVTIQVKVGQITLSTENLQAAIDKVRRDRGLRADEDITSCDLQVNRTLSVYDYNGKLEGDSVYYAPPGAFDEGEWYSPNNNLAAGENLDAEFNIPTLPELYKKEVVDAETGLRITVPEGKSARVLFRWDGEGNYLGAKVEIRPWGYVYDPHEF